MTQPVVLIIGAGMSGLAAANRLRELRFDTIVIDKGRGVGGRMATRRMTGKDGVEARVDHGAQFFTSRTPQFGEALEQWQRLGVATQWSLGFPSTVNGSPERNGHPRYRGSEGMTSIPKHLAIELDLRLGHRVTHVSHDGDRWTVQSATGDAFHADAVLLTAPVPQALALLDKSGIELDSGHRADLNTIVYHCCLVTMAVLDGPSNIPAPGAIQFLREPVDWIADNRVKGISPNATAITIHAAASFSRKHFDGDREAAADLMLESCAGLLGSRVVERQIHGWRYSSPIRCHPDRSLMLSVLPPLVLAGDAFGGPRVEGAYLSGRTAAEQIAATMGSRR